VCAIAPQLRTLICALHPRVGNSRSGASVASRTQANARARSGFEARGRSVMVVVVVVVVAASAAAALGRGRAAKTRGGWKNDGESLVTGYRLLRGRMPADSSVERATSCRKHTSYGWISLSSLCLSLLSFSFPLCFRRRVCACARVRACVCKCR